MKLRHLVLCMCISTVCMTGNIIAEEQQKAAGEGGKEKREGLKHGAKAPGMREGLERKHPGGEGLSKLENESGMQEAFLGKILGNPEIASQVGLSEDQVKALKDSVAEMRKQNETLMKQLKDAALEQAKLMTGDSPDEAAILAAVEKTGNIKTEMAKCRIKHMLFVKKNLKPEQVAKLKELLQKRAKQMHGDKPALKEKSGGESTPFRDRLRERRKKNLQPEEDKEKKDGDTGKPAENAKPEV